MLTTWLHTGCEFALLHIHQHGYNKFALLRIIPRLSIMVRTFHALLVSTFMIFYPVRTYDVPSSVGEVGKAVKSGLLLSDSGCRFFVFFAHHDHCARAGQRVMRVRQGLKASLRDTALLASCTRRCHPGQRATTSFDVPASLLEGLGGL